MGSEKVTALELLVLTPRGTLATLTSPVLAQGPVGMVLRGKTPAPPAPVPLAPAPPAPEPPVPPAPSPVLALARPRGAVWMGACATADGVSGGRGCFGSGCVVGCMEGCVGNCAGGCWGGGGGWTKPAHASQEAKHLLSQPSKVQVAKS